ncbi:glycoside hydrolase family 99-like domain-containing protein [Nonomuraea zeae]|uniref:DUF5648 domain-containing protein n=1 Tax=Nonomuraea zeae TaxID=1642303 RepID=A0A5S4GH60_9ACTN|nr:glycoside hydrolase family 99-like domain-containing protein [Nonomuraea zeae]TMR31864.1 hypothetical protein ETD85_24530 [Nonomuraea zeae]
MLRAWMAGAAALVVACLLLVPDTERPARAAGSPVSQVTDPVPMFELLAPGGVGRFYTLSPSEATSAVTRHGFTRLEGHAGYWRTAEFSGSQPVYRLRAGSSYLLTASASERDSLVAGGRFAYEGIAGHLWSQPGSGRQRMWRFSRSGVWRLALESRTKEMVAAGYAIDGSLGWIYPQWIRAGAIYFGTFNPDAKNMIKATKNVFGRDNDWWGGVRDFSGGDPSVPQNTQGWDDDFRHLKPQIGFYDDSRPETLETHIAQATEGGLDFFQFYWYWDTVSKQSPAVFKASLSAFAQARNRSDIDFTLTICAHPWGGLQIPKEDFATVARHLTSQFLDQSNYLRANDGRLVVSLCDRRGLGDGSDADTQAFVNAVRHEARDVLGEELLVLGNWEAMLDRSAPTRWGADGAYCGVRIDHVKSYENYVNQMPAYLDAGPTQFMRCAASDFDERPRFPHLIPDRSKIRYYADQTPELFAAALSRVRSDITESRRISAVDNFVSIYAWNEFHEGGVIEPNAKDGCMYLGLVREHLALHTGAPCKTQQEPASK